LITEPQVFQYLSPVSGTLCKSSATYHFEH
jgi:hypothetical protein